MRRLLLSFLLLFTISTTWAEAPLSRIAFGSCLHQDVAQPILETILNDRPQLFLFLGDNIYADTRNEKELRSVYAKQKANPGVQKLFTTVPVLATWDDHDYGENDAGVEYPMKKESQSAFLDYFGVKPDSDLRSQNGVYSEHRFGPRGQRVQIILLDTRSFRSPLKSAGRRSHYVPFEDPNATMLGDQQWAWLEEQLKSPAEIRIIASSIQVIAEEHPFEKWGNFPSERRRLLELIRKTQATGVVLISGDRHLAELSRLGPRNTPFGYPLFDLTSSSLNRSTPSTEFPETNRHRIAHVHYGDNFGVIEIDWKKDPVIRLQIKDLSGHAEIDQPVPLSQLKPPASSTEK